MNKRDQVRQAEKLRKKKEDPDRIRVFVVPWGGIEPPTLRFSDTNSEKIESQASCRFSGFLRCVRWLFWWLLLFSVIQGPNS